MKRQFCLLLALLMLVSLLGLEWTKADAIVPGEDAAPAGEKIYCNATLEDDFAPDRVLVVLTNAASTSLKTYGLTDFTGYGFKSVTNLTSATTALANAKIQGKPIPEEFSTNANVITFEDFYDVELEKFNQILCLELKTPGKQNVLNAIKVLEKHPDVKYAGPDYYATMFSSDLQIQNQYLDEHWALDMIDLPEAWEIAIDRMVLVGVLDSGIDTNHPGLVDSMYSQSATIAVNSYNCMLDDSPVTLSGDSTGHGTAVASTVATISGNGIGLTGSSFPIKLISLKVFQSGSDATISYVDRAIDKAMEVGVQILVFSAGFYITGNDTRYTALYEMIEGYSGLFVCAAGNDARNLDTPNADGQYVLPAAYDDLDNLITVGAITQDDELLYCSNYSATSVDILAPGENILACFPTNMCSGACSYIGHYAPGYHWFDKTSSAAPIVAGVAALVLASEIAKKEELAPDIEPIVDPETIKEAMMHGAYIPYIGTVSKFGDLCSSGGVVNAYQTLHDHSLEMVSYNSTHHKEQCACGRMRLYSHCFQSSVVQLPMGQIMYVSRCADCGHEE